MGPSSSLKRTMARLPPMGISTSTAILSHCGVCIHLFFRLVSPLFFSIMVIWKFLALPSSYDRAPPEEITPHRSPRLRYHHHLQTPLDRVGLSYWKLWLCSCLYVHIYICIYTCISLVVSSVPRSMGGSCPETGFPRPRQQEEERKKTNATFVFRCHTTVRSSRILACLIFLDAEPVVQGSKVKIQQWGCTAPRWRVHQVPIDAPKPGRRRIVCIHRGKKH